jgi:Protein of unknown function (DUF2950)
MSRAAHYLGALAAASVLWFATAALAADYASPDAAVDALVSAVRSNAAAAIEHVLGKGSKRLVVSGDPVADQAGRAAFIAAYDASHTIEPKGDEAVLVIGKEAWPFPIPLRKDKAGWRFDTRAGARDILDRRIGRNELNAIKTCRAIVDAERDYASVDRTGAGVVEYAQKFMSSRGKKDGLYWPAGAGAGASPLGPLVAEARAQGYGGRHAPYHGYYYKILKRQGPHAPDGARDYVVRGHMIGGFAVVAYPAKWGASGIMTFIVDRGGIVHEKNLGRDSARIAAAMTRYDPDPSWRPVADEGPH